MPSFPARADLKPDMTASILVSCTTSPSFVVGRLLFGVNVLTDTDLNYPCMIYLISAIDHIKYHVPRKTASHDFLTPQLESILETSWLPALCDEHVWVGFLDEFPVSLYVSFPRVFSFTLSLSNFCCILPCGILKSRSSL